MAVPLNKREYRAFLSHAHTDKQPRVDGLYSWLTRSAGLKVWYDAVDFPTGPIGSRLGEAIENCQAAIIVLSKAALDSGWVEQEWNVCFAQRRAFPDFQIIPVLLEECECPAFLQVLKSVDLTGPELHPNALTQLIEALYWHLTRPPALSRRQVYVARGSHGPEVDAANSIVRLLRSAGIQSCRDSPENQKFLIDRIQRLLGGCCGLIAAAPHRGAGLTSKYIVSEIDLAVEAGLPVFVVCDRRVDRNQFAHLRGVNVLEADLSGEVLDDPILRRQIEEFIFDLDDTETPAYAFLGFPFRNADRERWERAKRCLEVVSGLRCVIGDNIVDQDVQERIIQLISGATFAVLDISDDALNTCIEAGVALGARVPIHLVARGDRHAPKPFLFRKHNLLHYQTEPELLGLMRQVSLPYMRVFD